VVQVLERHVADEAMDQEIEWFAAEHVGVGDREHVLAAQGHRDVAQLGDAPARRPGGAHERPHAGADDLRRHEPALGERLQNADVGEAFHAAAAQHESKSRLGVHVTRRLPGR
jgi:hypothetical protein